MPNTLSDFRAKNRRQLLSLLDKSFTSFTFDSDEHEKFLLSTNLGDLAHYKDIINSSLEFNLIIDCREKDKRYFDWVCGFCYTLPKEYALAVAAVNGGTLQYTYGFVKAGDSVQRYTSVFQIKAVTAREALVPGMLEVNICLGIRTEF